MSPRDRSLWRPRPLDDHRPQTTGTSRVCCSLELNHAIFFSSGQRRTAPPPDWVWFLPRFFSPFLLPMEFWFLTTVAFGLLKLGIHGAILLSYELVHDLFLMGEIIDARMVMARIVWEGFTSLTSASWAPDYFYSILIRELSALHL